MKNNPYAHEGGAGGYHDEDPCIIKGPMGTGLPIFLQNEIAFNGDESKHLDHESFYITWNNKDEDGEDLYGFCKTARKPYDILVCMSLLALEESFNDPKVFSFSSDGDDTDWYRARDLYKEILWRNSLIKPSQKKVKKIEK